MTAVAEEAPAAVQHDPIANWRPPLVRQGEMILFYPDAQRSMSPSIGFATSVEYRTLTVLLIGNGGGSVKFDVMHVDDPMFKNHPHRRTNGGWDKSEFGKLEERIAALEAMLAGHTPDSAIHEGAKQKEAALNKRFDGMQKYVYGTVERLENDFKALKDSVLAPPSSSK